MMPEKSRYLHLRHVKITSCWQPSRGLVISLAALLMGFSAPGTEAGPTGVWKTFDDKTGSAKALVRIFERNGQLFGTIEKGLQQREKHVCDLCTDERKGQPLVGMEIMRRMKKSGTEYAGGDILDPDTGKVYRCKMRLEDGGKKLVVRGFVGFSLLGRSQVWIRQD